VARSEVAVAVLCVLLGVSVGVFAFDACKAFLCGVTAGTTGVEENWRVLFRQRSAGRRSMLAVKYILNLCCKQACVCSVEVGKRSGYDHLVVVSGVLQSGLGAANEVWWWS
jgi:hypothetical protein